MLKFIEKNKFYKLPENEYKQVLHNQPLPLKLLILVKVEDVNKSLEPEVVEMLDKMVNALSIAQNEVEYVLFSKQLSLVQLLQEFEVDSVLVFGAETIELDLNMELKYYQVYNFSAYRILFVNDLIDLYSNQNLKGKLWSQLKTMFT